MAPYRTGIFATLAVVAANIVCWLAYDHSKFLSMGNGIYFSLHTVFALLHGLLAGGAICGTVVYMQQRANRSSLYAVRAAVAAAILGGILYFAADTAWDYFGIFLLHNRMLSPGDKAILEGGWGLLCSFGLASALAPSLGLGRVWLKRYTATIFLTSLFFLIDYYVLFLVNLVLSVGLVRQSNAVRGSFLVFHLDWAFKDAFFAYIFAECFAMAARNILGPFSLRLKEASQIREINLDGAAFTIGSEQASDLYIPPPQGTSSILEKDCPGARILVSAEGVQVVQSSLKTISPTFVNSHSSALQDGESVTVGGVTLTLLKVPTGWHRLIAAYEEQRDKFRSPFED